MPHFERRRCWGQDLDPVALGQMQSPLACERGEQQHALGHRERLAYAAARASAEGEEREERDARFSPPCVQRSGSNASGSGKKRGSRCIAYWQTTTSAPDGMT